MQNCYRGSTIKNLYDTYASITLSLIRFERPPTHPSASPLLRHRRRRANRTVNMCYRYRYTIPLHADTRPAITRRMSPLMSCLQIGTPCNDVPDNVG
ncbi:hypothetical protein EVAR_88659_1 [Eumeta japonica]|uniref:Uncharacterized protein n=1 Tax=Eumeta variegata TaxID=151549 RepID=A0A4C1YBH0_EUMVA|nr:hypothetical protein EVAR_88659_1 [Eumeta japonica]